MKIELRLSKIQKILTAFAGIIISLGVIFAFLAPLIPYAKAEDLKSVEERVEALEALPEKIDNMHQSIETMKENAEAEKKAAQKQKLVDKIKRIDGKITEIDLEIQFIDDEERKGYLIQKKIYWNGEKQKYQTDLNALNTG